MELATKRNSDAKAHLRALVNGQYAGDADALIKEIATDLLAGVIKGLKAKPGAEVSARAVSGVAQKEIASRLAEWLIKDDRQSSTDRRQLLPVAKWSPEEVVARTGVSKSTLYRGDQMQFYSVVPMGKKNGRAYPAWQFIGDVPSVLPAVLTILHGNSRLQVNTFFMSEQDALNELCPAEVLAGMPFEDRTRIPPEQERLLALPAKTRLAKVSTLARMEVADPD